MVSLSSLFTTTYVGFTGSQGAGFIERTEESQTTSSIANSANEDITLSGFKSYALYKIQTSAASWVRIYTNEAARTADIGRAQGQDPAPDSGVIAEVITTGNETVVMSPAVFGFNDEDPITTNIPANVTNLSGSTASITVTITLVKLEV